MLSLSSHWDLWVRAGCTMLQLKVFQIEIYHQLLIIGQSTLYLYILANIQSGFIWPKRKCKIWTKYDYRAWLPVHAKYAAGPPSLSVEHSQIVALFSNLRFSAPPPIKSGRGPKSAAVVKVALSQSFPVVVSANCTQCLLIKYLNCRLLTPRLIHWITINWNYTGHILSSYLCPNGLPSFKESPPLNVFQWISQWARRGISLGWLGICAALILLSSWTAGRSTPLLLLTIVQYFSEMYWSCVL